jgi:hypothetical protein
MKFPPDHTHFTVPGHDAMKDTTSVADRAPARFSFHYCSAINVVILSMR